MRKLIDKQSPNREYVSLSTAFAFFNRRLFAGTLPPAIITLQRHAGAYGYYSKDRFESRRSKSVETDEIALNPGLFAGRTDEEILSTLVHEMAHHWQRHFGKPGRGRYHNRQWADKMEEIGLMPTSTGAPSGRRTGDRVSHYIIKNGPFAKVCKDLLKDGVRLEWQSLPSGETKNRNKVRYTCGNCEAHVWGKPGLKIRCELCDERFREESAD